MPGSRDYPGNQMTSPNYVIEARNLTKSYGQHRS